MKTYVTFGQIHVHHVNGKIFNKDCVAVIESDSREGGRAKAFEVFGRKFCFSYYEKEFNPEQMEHYPRGFIVLNEEK